MKRLGVCYEVTHKSKSKFQLNACGIGQKGTQNLFQGGHDHVTEAKSHDLGAP